APFVQMLDAHCAQGQRSLRISQSFSCYQFHSIPGCKVPVLAITSHVGHPICTKQQARNLGADPGWQTYCFDIIFFNTTDHSQVAIYINTLDILHRYVRGYVNIAGSLSIHIKEKSPDFAVLLLRHARTRYGCGSISIQVETMKRWLRAQRVSQKVKPKC